MKHTVQEINPGRLMRWNSQTSIFGPILFCKLFPIACKEVTYDERSISLLRRRIENHCSFLKLTAKLTAKLANFYSPRRTPANKLARDEARPAARTSPYKKRHEKGT